jgi:sulfopyruvate decarboxylase alpha subunit
LTGADFCELTSALKYDFFTGVPDSTLGTALKVLESDLRYLYVPAVREDNAVGMAVGAYLGGKNPVVLMQNSGLGLCLNALTSLVSLYKIPLLLVIGWRGADEFDAPEHILMGSASPALLTAVGIPFWIPARDDVTSSLSVASLRSRSENSPVALLIRERVID